MKSGKLLWLAIAALGTTVLLCRPAPADEQADSSVSDRQPRLPELTVTGPALGEETLIGPNKQPEWTTARRFVRTRGYVLAPWQFSADLGYEVRRPGEDEERHRLRQELELGLPYRFQLDYEARGETESGGSEWDLASQSVELRWALAEWGKIPTNPTLFAEWTFIRHEADAYELKLLFTDELAPRWHWGVNLFFEQQVGDHREREVAASGGLSYSVVDRRFGVGVESKLTSETANDEDGYHTFLQLGPSIQWRICPRVRLDVAPLFGIVHEAPLAELFVILGFDFVPGSFENEATEPASIRGR